MGLATLGLIARTTIKEDEVTGTFVLVRVRRVLVLFGLVFAALPIASAVATTVGQTGPPQSNGTISGGQEFAQTSAAMPAAGIVTSFQTQAGSDILCGGGEYDFQVLRP